jgi:hypothetical protein
MYKPVLNVYFKHQRRIKRERLAGMVRGLLNSYDGYRSISGLTNARFAANERIRLRFSTVGKAHAFKRVADTVFNEFVTIRKVVV